MRTAKHKQHKRHSSADDEAVGRMYRTIPNYQTGAGDQSGQKSGAADQPSKSRRWKKVFKRTILVLCILLALSGLWLGWKFVANTVKVFGWDGLWDLFRSQKLDGEDQGRVNILLAGNSADDPGHGGAALTDSIMLASINTKDKTGYIISIPRDLYADIPGSGYAKINEAYQDGEQNKFSEPGYAAGGMGLLEKTVAQHFGVKIHYYALVNYAGLQQAVDAVGGVKVTITSNDPRGLYDPSPDLQNNYTPLVNLPNGPVTLNGRDALNLSRARGNAWGSYGYGLSDFVRTENQRKVLIGLKEKATSAGTLANPIKLGGLLDSLGSNVKTDFEPSELRRLYKLTKDIPDKKIASVSLNDANGENLLMGYQTRFGQSALVPAAGIDDYSVIQAFIAGL